jgi:hypothetical protein
MKRKQSLAVALAERLCRPQRIGVFGHRGVGKTTLLSMLYREAVGGRLPELRLAAADARTAEYLSDKVLQLEAGQPLPATLGETELRFHLYYHGVRLDLLFKDYQGEHVALGRQEPIRDFLRDCDGVWLCLDVPAADTPGTRLQAEQEVEQIVEDYLVVETPGSPPRPMALVVTKADLLPGGIEAAATGEGVHGVVSRHFRMTRHTLDIHCPHYGLFAVTSLGGSMPPAEGSIKPFAPHPAGLAGPLTWLADSLQTQDEARLNPLWELAHGDIRLLERCVASFAHRYPSTPATEGFQRRLRAMRRQRRRRHSLVGVLTAACMLIGVGSYDAWGQQRASRFAVDHADDPIAVRQNWLAYQTWHPTRNVLRPAAAEAEKKLLEELGERIRISQYNERLSDLRRRAADPDADAEVVWQELQTFHREFPEHNVDSEWQTFRSTLKTRRDTERERRAERAFAELEGVSDKMNLAERIEQTDRFLQGFSDTTRESAVRRLRAAWLLRLEERDIESARAYSASQPLNFQTRRERYQRYLELHPSGAFVKEAMTALASIAADWDRHDFRTVRDHFQAHPGDVKELQVHCRSYLAVHPDGRFRDSAHELLRWTERVTQPGEYRVVLKSGNFDRKVAYFLSRGPSLSVEIEVNGIRYGPSNIVARSYQPEWSYEFPRRVRWKLGDSVRIMVTDHYYWNRGVGDVWTDDSDPLGMRMLSGAVAVGTNTLTFESDFTMPVLPKIE